MINKYAELYNRVILYNACKGILRIKIAQHYTEKRAFPVVQVVGGTIGAGVGGYAGYKGGDALAKYWNLADDSWQARGLRYGGATLGGIGGAVLGAVAPTMLVPAAGTTATGVGTAAAGTAAAGTTAAGTAAAGTTAGSALLNTIGTVGTVASTGSSLIDLANSIKGKPKE